MIHIMETAEKLGTKIVTEGRSIRNNLEIAEKTGLLTIDKSTIIPAQDIGKYPPDKIVILSTGAQGEEFAALMRIATKQHKNITLNERDTIVLSSSVIPGNESRRAEVEGQSLSTQRHAYSLSLLGRPLHRPRQHGRACLD